VVGEIRDSGRDTIDDLLGRSPVATDIETSSSAGAAWRTHVINARAASVPATASAMATTTASID
jgi:hypothetical protein